MMEKARRGTKHVVMPVETELAREGDNERNEAGAFSGWKTSLALPWQGIMPIYVELS